MITISYCEFGSLSRCKIFYFPTLLQLGACMISYAMNVPLFKDIFIHVLTVLWPNVYVVISKMFPCHHYDINSESNRCTSPTSTFSWQIWGYKIKDKQIKKLTKCRTRIIWSLDWILSSYPYTGREKNVKRCHFASPSRLHTGNSESLCFLSLSFQPLSEVVQFPPGFLTPYSRCTNSIIRPVIHKSVTGGRIAAELYIWGKSQDTQTSLSEVFRTLKYKMYA